MKISCDNKRCTGLTLVEVVISALIIGVVVTALYAVYIYARNTLTTSLYKMVALYWAQEEIERLKVQVRGPLLGPPANSYTDEQNNYPFGRNSLAGGGGYPVPDPIRPGTVPSHRDLVARGASISYPTVFGGSTYTPPSPRPFLYNVQSGGRNIFNLLSAERGAIIYQHVDSNSASSGTGFRQVTIRVRW